jgi:hypothetical protein
VRKKLVFLLFLFACVVAVSSCQANVNDNTSAEDVVCNHVFGEWITVKQANCKEDGLLLRTCTKCSETEGTNIAKNNIHTTVIDKAIDATCTTDGKTEGTHCSVCGIVLVAQNTIPAHHTFSEWQVKILPKYAYDGIEERVCECGITEERTMTKLEIDFSSYVFDNTKEYEIEFWVKNDANIAQKNVWIDAVKSFNKLYPNITIKLKHYTDSSRIYSDLIVQNEKPDAVLIKPSYIFDMNNSFDLISLNNLISDLNCGIEYGEDEIFKHLLDLSCIDGNFFAVPFIHSSQICYINKTYVEKLGYEIPDVLTWNFILEVSSAAIKKDSESGLYEINNGKTMIPISCKNPSDLLSGLLNENGVNSIFDKENSEFNDTARQVFSYIEDMISKGLLTTFAQSGYPSNLFVEGKCIFAFDSSAESTWFGTDSPNSDVLERIDFKTVVRNIPCKSFQNLINYEQGL